MNIVLFWLLVATTRGHYVRKQWWYVYYDQTESWIMNKARPSKSNFASCSLFQRQYNSPFGVTGLNIQAKSLNAITKLYRSCSEQFWIILTSKSIKITLTHTMFPPMFVKSIVLSTKFVSFLRFCSNQVLTGSIQGLSGDCTAGPLQESQGLFTDTGVWVKVGKVTSDHLIANSKQQVLK